MTATKTRHTLSLAGTEVVVEVQGSGPLVLFVPGGAATTEGYWLDLPEQVATFASAATVDRPGTGRSAVTESLHLDEQAAHLAAIIEAVDLGPALVVGHSLGGVLAMDVAIHAPELPGGVVIVDSVPFLAALMMPGIKTEADARMAASGMGAAISAQDREQFVAGQKQFVGGMITSPEKAAAMAELTGKSDPATTGQAMTELLDRDLRAEVAAIRCPTVVFVALADKVAGSTTREMVERAYRHQFARLPEVRFEIFDQAKHFIMVDDPAGFDAALQRELDRP